MTHEEKAELVNTIIVNYLRLDDEGKIWFNNKVNGWISVNDRFPESENEVLLYGDEEIAIGHFKFGSFWYYSHYGLTNIDNGIITHWMPLPEPPKE